MSAQTYQPVYNATAAEQAVGSAGPANAITTFEYQYGNAAGLGGPATESDGLSKGAVAGIVIGCILGGFLFGSLVMLCYLKRRRLFPAK
jgi:hypothetical protein